VEAAGALWHALIQYATRSLPAVGWTPPTGIAFLDVCDPSGGLPTPACPTVVNEVFLEGNQPHQEDQLYQTFKINRETGRLATIFTPSELVQKRTFMLIPAEGRLWAQQAGIASPPEDYDAVPPASSSPQVQISEPAMFAYLSGKVAVRGTVAGDDLDFYRLQAGKGLNPDQWVQIGEDVTRPADNTNLFEWDTSQLSGLYTLQLLRVKKDHSLQTATIQVAIDNAPPSLQILYPGEGELVQANGLGAVTFQLSAEDDLALKSVQFFVDGNLLAEQGIPPFSLPWKAEPGEHVLKALATDMAGNEAEAQSSFSVK
jgi:hypothetical protein